MPEILLENLVAEFIDVFDHEASPIILPRDDVVVGRVVNELVGLRKEERQFRRHKRARVGHLDAAVQR